MLLKVTVNKLTSLFGAGAISLFYWYAAPVLAQTIFGKMSTPAFVWPTRGVLWALALVWLVRTWRKEPTFVEQATATVDTKLGQGALKALRTAPADAAEVTFEPTGSPARSRRREHARVSAPSQPLDAYQLIAALTGRQVEFVVIAGSRCRPRDTFAPPSIST